MNRPAFNNDHVSPRATAVSAVRQMTKTRPRWLWHTILSTALLLLAAAAPEAAKPKPSGFQNLGPLLGQFPSLPAPPYKLKWTYKADEGDIVPIVGSPVVVGEVVYLA